MASSINALAQQLTSMAQAPPGQNASNLSVTALTGVVTALQLSATPPTITVQISGSATPVAGVAFDATYVPTLGDTVNLMKQGTVLWATGVIATAPIVAPPNILVPDWGNGKINAGIYSGTTNGSAAFTFNHGCSFTPTVAILAPVVGFTEYCFNSSFGSNGLSSTQASIACWSAGAFVYSTGVAVYGIFLA